MIDGDDAETEGGIRMQLREKPQAALLRLADVSANRCCHCCHGERQVHMLLLKALDDALWLPFFQRGWRRGVEEGAAAHTSSEKKKKKLQSHAKVS